MTYSLESYLVQVKLSNGYWGFTNCTAWNIEGAIAIARARYGKRLVKIECVINKTGKINA